MMAINFARAVGNTLKQMAVLYLCVVICIFQPLAMIIDARDARV